MTLEQLEELKIIYLLGWLTAKDHPQNRVENSKVMKQILQKKEKKTKN